MRPDIPMRRPRPRPVRAPHRQLLTAGLAPLYLRKVILRRQRTQQSSCTLVLLADGRLVATAKVVIEDKLSRGGSRVARLEDVVVCAASRKGGFGRLVVEEAFRVAARAGAWRVNFAARAEAVTFYEHIADGRITRAKDQMYELVLGSWLQAGAGPQ